MTEMQITDHRRPMIAAEDVNPISMMFDPVIADRVLAIAKTLAAGQVTVPEHLRGNVGDCLAIVMQAASWRLNPFAVAQKTHLVQGKLGYEAQLINAIATSLRVIEGRFAYEYVGDWKKIAKKPKMAKSAKGYDIPAQGWNEADEDGLSVIVSATIRGERQTRSHELLLVQSWPRNSTLWPTNPQQQIAYLAVKQWMRKYAPDAILGIYTTDEIEPEHYMGQVEVLSSAATLREIQCATRHQEPAAAQGAATTQAARTEAAHEQQESASAEWPKEHNGNLYDSRGVVWDGVVHSGQMTCNSDGTWRRRKGVAPDTVAAAEARYPHIDPLVTFRNGPAIQSGPAPLDLAPSDIPTFADALTWIETAQNLDALNSALDASRSIDMDQSGRDALDAAAVAQASLIELQHNG